MEATAHKYEFMYGAQFEWRVESRPDTDSYTCPRRLWFPPPGPKADVKRQRLFFPKPISWIFFHALRGRSVH
jgi:hypothetical protein